MQVFFLRGLKSLSLVFAFSLSVAAQAIVGGPGSISFPTLDATAVTFNQSLLGVQYSPSTGTLFLSGRGNFTAGVYNNVAPHTLYEISTSGVLLNSYVQPNMTSVWGLRDGATDGTILFFGDEMGTHAFDPATGTFVQFPTVMAANGPQVAGPFPIAPPAPLTIVRSLAFNPAGNGGNGSFWTADFGSALYEFDLAGNVLTTHLNTSQWSFYGLAYDPIRGMLWGNSSPNAGDLVEIDPATGTPTGNRIRRTISNATQGGCCFYQRPGGNPYSELLVLDQGAPDTLTGYRLDLYDPVASGGRGHWDEVRLQTDVNGAGFGVTDRLFTDGDTLAWSYGARPLALGLPNLPALMLLVIGPQANVFANSVGIPGFVIPNSFSVPGSMGTTFTIGDGFGLNGLIAQNLGPIGPNTTAAAAQSFVWPPAGPLLPGDSIRLQALVPDNGIYGPLNPFGVYATNSSTFTYRMPGCDGTDFEGLPTGLNNYPVGWANGPGGTDQWQPIAGSTPSAGTGATTGNSGTTYMYCEASGAANTWPKTYVMDTVALNTCSNPTPNLFFAYHMWGTTVGTLTVETIDALGASTGIVFTITGDQGNQWNTTTVPVTPTGGTVRVRFTYVTPAANNSWVGDACLDDVFIL